MDHTMYEGILKSRKGLKTWSINTCLETAKHSSIIENDMWMTEGVNIIWVMYLFITIVLYTWNHWRVRYLAIYSKNATAVL